MIVEKTLFPLTMTASPALIQRHLGLLKIYFLPPANDVFLNTCKSNYNKRGRIVTVSPPAGRAGLSNRACGGFPATIRQAHSDTCTKYLKNVI